MERYAPSNRNANIHGMTDVWGNQTCKTRTGSMCTACCTFFQVIDRTAGLSVPAGQQCEYQVPCRGCSVHNNRPNSCRPYHCSQSGVPIKMQLLEIALANAETNTRNATEMVQIWSD